MQASSPTVCQRRFDGSTKLRPPTVVVGHQSLQGASRNKRQLVVSLLVCELVVLRLAPVHQLFTFRKREFGLSATAGSPIKSASLRLLPELLSKPVSVHTELFGKLLGGKKTGLRGDLALGDGCESRKCQPATLMKAMLAERTVSLFRAQLPSALAGLM